jgi:hypothetical protein
MVPDHDEAKKILLELWKASRDVLLRRAALRATAPILRGVWEKESKG